MRTKRSMINVGAAVAGQGLSLGLGFVVRWVFLLTLGEKYLGVNSLFSSLISMFSLLELGAGPAFLHSLYKPLADGDTEKIKSLMRFFSKAYRVIGGAVAVLGVATLPFLPLLFKDPPQVEHLEFIFLLFVFYSASSYFVAYKRTLLSADQRQYLITAVHYLCYTVLSLAELAVLLFLKSYILYLTLQILATLSENLILTWHANRRYSYLLTKKERPLSQKEKRQLIFSARAMVFHQVGSVAVNSTDNLLISRLVGTKAVGAYSNYGMILNALGGIMAQVFTAITASVGNLGAVEEAEKQKRVFNLSFFLGIFSYGVLSVCLWFLAEPFLLLWLGQQDLLFPRPVLFIIVITFFLNGIRRISTTFRNAFGLHWRDRYRPLAEAVVNLGVSVLLALRLGLLGILLGTVVGIFATSFWIEPLILYKYAFHAPLRDYFKRYFSYVGALLLCAFPVGLFLRWWGTPRTWIQWILQGGSCLALSAVGFLLLFCRTEEFRSLLKITEGLFSKIFSFKKKQDSV